MSERRAAHERLATGALARWARACATHPWRVVFGWLAIVVVLTSLWARDNRPELAWYIGIVAVGAYVAWAVATIAPLARAPDRPAGLRLLRVEIRFRRQRHVLGDAHHRVADLRRQAHLPGNRQA